MADLQKTRLLRIARAGTYAQMDPQELDQLHRDVLSFPTETLRAPDFFALLELHFYVSLLTNRDVAAKGSLDRIVDQFGHEKSQRVKILRLLYLQAVGEEDKAVALLSGNTDELELSRRLITFSRKSNNSNNENSNAAYIKTLLFYLDLNPADIKTWAELAGEYAKARNYDKAVYCYKEVLLHEPSAYNIFYQVGLMHYYRFVQSETATKEKKDKVLEAVEDLTKARDNFLRSIEICGSYSKGWAGVSQILGLEFNQRISEKFGTTREVKKYLEDNEKLLAVVTKRAK